MTDEELKRLPATALKILTETKKKINQIYADNANLIIQLNSNDFYSFRSFDERFLFSINQISLNSKNELICNVVRTPQSANNINQSKTAVLVSKCHDHFSGWISLVKLYNEALNEYYDPFYRQFENEFLDEFSIDDWDNSTTLNTDQQLKVYKLLGNIELKLKTEDQSNPEIQKLLAYTQDFKENLHTLPKSVIKIKSIQFLAKLRKYGIKLFYDTLEIGYKEIIKFALHSGADGIHHLLK